MGAAYYAKLTIFLLMAAIGGLLGAAIGAAMGLSLWASIHVLGGRDLFNPALEFYLVAFLVSGLTIAGFIWSYVRSYTILVETFW